MSTAARPNLLDLPQQARFLIYDFCQNNCAAGRLDDHITTLVRDGNGFSRFGGCTTLNALHWTCTRIHDELEDFTCLEWPMEVFIYNDGHNYSEPQDSQWRLISSARHVDLGFYIIKRTGLELEIAFLEKVLTVLRDSAGLRTFTFEAAKALCNDRAQASQFRARLDKLRFWTTEEGIAAGKNNKDRELFFAQQVAALLKLDLALEEPMVSTSP